jgi:hypothetical protein
VGPPRRGTFRPGTTAVLSAAMEQRLGGTVVLVNPDASEIQLPIANVEVTENVIEFESHYKNDTFYWSLTVQKNGNQGLLHGSCREMLIDERVQKQPV